MRIRSLVTFQDPSPSPRWRSRRWLVSLVALPALVVLTGCVPQNQYDDLMTAYRSQEQQLLACQADLESSRANEAALRNQLARAAEDLRALEAFRDGQGGDLGKLRADYEALLKRLEDLKLTALPENLSNALRDLAARFGDLVTFDEKRGMLRFNSDVTFDLGDATLRPKAADLLRQLAPILNSPEARPFEIKVLGHTDNVPIKRDTTKAKHPTNVFLSAHRAISVRDALVSDGVQAGRIEVAGFGEFRPIVPNGPGGAAQNRRVEVFLTPATGSFDAPASASGGSGGGGGAPAAPTKRPPAKPVDDMPVK
ncbi:MAG: OmpA family protein [Phycisphaerales bacterium]